MNKMQKFALEGIGITKEMAIEHFGIEATKEPVKFGEARLAGEDEVFIYFPGDDLTVGSEVYSNEELTDVMADGEYPLESGYVLTVADGAATDIVEVGADEEDAPAEDVPDEEQELDEAFDAEGFKAEILELLALFNERVEKLEELGNKNTEDLQKLSKASATVHKSNPKVEAPKKVSNYKTLTGAEKLRAHKNK